MASLDSLPPDQRAVLELVLKRGRTYDEIAKMLSIDRAGVRERALSAFDALGPQTRVPPERRALITDYLLGQLPAKLSDDTRQRLAQSASERAWARVLASELDSVAESPLPEIPADGAREPEPATVPAREPVAAPAAAAEPSPAAAAASDSASQPRGLAARPSSRRGGIILLSLGALVVVAAVVVIALLSGGGSKKNATTTASQSGSTSSTPTTSSTPSSTTSTSTTAANGAKLVAQINLTAPASAAATKPVGVALVLKQGNNTGIAIRAQNLPANGKHDAYAVWLYKSDKDNHILGFVNPSVGSNGVLQAESALPTNAGHFNQLLITKETQQNPKSPGTVVLQGTLKGLS
jgi:hypothetical protein